MSLPNFTNVKGYSHEKFKSGTNTIYKYSKNPNRKEFVLRQFYWLKGVQSAFPKYGFDSLFLINDENETGYSMNRIGAKEMTAKNAKDLIQIVLDIKIPATDIKTIMPDYTLPVRLCSGFYEYEVTDDKIKFENYIKYLKKIVLRNPDIFPNFNWEKYERKLKGFLDFANNNLSFYHGDFTVDNIMWDGDKYTLIDPNFKTDMWGSYLLDLSKLYQETRFDNIEMFRELKVEIQARFRFDEHKMQFVELLELGHYIRMIPYVINFPDIYQIKRGRLEELHDILLTN